MKHIWLVGLGGIGHAVKEALDKKALKLSCFSRQGDTPFDIISEAAITELVDNAPSLPDALIITAGTLHDDHHGPEKTITALQSDWLHHSIDINVLPSLFFAKALTKRLNRHHAITMASFSARVSSISDNRLGGWHSYRMSKCMLNMLIKNIAIEWQLKTPRSIIFGYHPGTVDTPLSKPFQQRVAKEKLFSSERAAQYFLECLNTRQTEHSGKLYDWQMKEIMP